jgi:hypothetical protein
MNIKDQFLCFSNFKLQNGKQIRFWEDRWMRVHTLKDQYPNKYNIVRKKSATVSNMFSTRPLNVSFRRSLVADNLQYCYNLVLRLANVYFKSASRPLVGFGVLDDNLSKDILSFVKYISRF